MGRTAAIYKGDAFETTVRERSAAAVHLGIDIFAPAHEPVHAPFAGTVAFLNDDAVQFGFGPTVLLEHKTERAATFSGHSTATCRGTGVATLSIGQAIAKGEAFCRLRHAGETAAGRRTCISRSSPTTWGSEARMHGVGVAAQWQIWREISPDPSVVFGSRCLPPSSSPGTRTFSCANATGTSAARSASPIVRRR